jgi:CRISPR-associated protein Cmr2
MTDALLIFTFSPIQSFIAEARRAADLYTGSQILVELAKAAAESIGKSRLIYPALDENGNLPADIPNKLVAKVPWEDCESIAAQARAALLTRWRELADEARQEFLNKTGLPFDMDIWNRHIADDYLWETYWSAASLDGRGYKAAYAEAERGLAAAKFTRSFAQYLEPGFKDTLSGKREALHAVDQDGREYWLQVGRIEPITPILIRPSTATRPRERLDAIGVIKRFHPKLSEREVKPFRGFPSTSSMASWTFLESARKYAPRELAEYREAVKILLPEPKYEVRLTDPDWPFDGDLLYLETLRPPRLESDYGKKESDYSADDLKTAQARLQDLYNALKKAAKDKKDPTIHTHPSPYYAILVLDGDSMGAYLRTLDEAGHIRFSQQLREFSIKVPGSAAKYLARVIYNGGDDVLALAPLDKAFAFAHALAETFHDKTKRTASAGIAIAHHLSPLGTALRAARRAEGMAKALRDEKNAVCLIALKRSGEPIEVRSGWEHTSPFGRLIEHFLHDDISSRLPYDVARSAYALPAADNKFEAELRRLLTRHWQKGNDKAKAASARDLSLALRQWAESFPQAVSSSPTEQLAGWLALARFIAKGGRE